MSVWRGLTQNDLLALYLKLTEFLPRDASAERGYEIACCPSVCPSVRPSVRDV